ncbi:hypothetical protein UZ36_02115 [Candidatus Nitromaritima sp. SCGC AAA799-C22]|nr:hypothetical protein UZ36_02115 [Candidatus Nitromaritima sp. SCGC AAA799-C22]
MKTSITFPGFLSIYLLTAQLAWAGHTLIPEPPLDTRLDWNPAPNGLLYVYYDLDGNHKADFIALRSVITSYYSPRTIGEIVVNHAQNLVFHVDYPRDRYYYIVSTRPLFYAIDVNEDGLWDILYKDVSRDGVNGNEEFYESPSGMFVNGVSAADPVPTGN